MVSSIRRALAASAIALGASGVACQIVAGIERVPMENTPPLPDVFEEPPLVIPDTCAHTQPPPAPATDDDPTASLGGELGLYFALRKVNLVQPQDAPPDGYDLDGVCTCTTGAGSRYGGISSCVAGDASVCDLTGGVDNRFSDILQGSAALLDVDKSANINSQIERGEPNTLIVITKYNGLADDKDVGIGLFTTEGLVLGELAERCPTSTPTPDGFYFPGWCGKDPWSVSKDSVNIAGSRFLPKVAGSGHVTDYRFVVQFDGVAWIPFGGYRLSLGGPIAPRRLVPLELPR